MSSVASRSVQVQADAAEAPARRPPIPRLGQQLRQAREQRGVGVRELARRAGVSASLVSQVEHGRTEPSLTTLYAFATALDLPLNELLFDEQAPNEPSSELPRDGGVVHEDERQTIRLDTSVVWQRLTSGRDPQVDFLRVLYPAGSASTTPDALLRHPGKEYGYVLSGRLLVTLGFDDHELAAGDSISFESTTPHRLAALGDEPVHAIWFVVGRHAEEVVE